MIKWMIEIRKTSVFIVIKWMIEIRKAAVFVKWIDGLRYIKARARILVRIERLAMVNPGDVKPVGEGVSEMKIDYGPSYRIYFKQRGEGKN